ncbi:hypothetical protein MKW92_021276 [Papaver armeniacum]|nr:hypothetical protein MKW92_021276 [Papaver armeniacum]
MAAARSILFSRMFSTARPRVFSTRNYTRDVASTVKEVESDSSLHRKRWKLEREIEDLERRREDLGRKEYSPGSAFSILAYGVVGIAGIVGFTLGIPLLYIKCCAGWYPRAVKRWPVLENKCEREEREKLYGRHKHKTCSAVLLEWESEG